MDATEDDTADDTAGSILGHVDYRHVVAILQKHYPLMDAEEAARMVLEYLRPQDVETDFAATADEA